MSNPDLSAALRVVLEHLRGTPAVPVPSISLPLAEFQALQAELLTLRAIASDLADTGRIQMAMNPRLVVKICDGWLHNPAGLAPHARAAAEVSDHG